MAGVAVAGWQRISGHSAIAAGVLGRRFVPFDSWWVRSVSLNGLGTLLDYSVFMLCARSLGLPTPVATITGLFCGATLNFFLNRALAFQDHKGPPLAQGLRYAMVVSGLALVHAAAAWSLRDGLGAPLLLAKVLADLACFTAWQPLLLRRFVFPPAPSPAFAGVRPGEPCATSA